MPIFPIKILMISGDSTLASTQQELGEVRERHKEYGKYVDKIFIACYTPLNEKYKRGMIADNVEIIPTLSKNKLAYFFDIWKIANTILSQNKIDLILAQDPFIYGLVAYLLSKKYSAKLLFHFHGDFLENPSWLKESRWNYFLLILCRLLIKKADAIRVVSKGLKAKVARAGVSEDKIFVINPPVDPKNFLTTNAEKIEKIKLDNAGRKIILFVGRLTAAKNLDFLFQVFKEVLGEYKNVNLVLAGKGELQDELQKQAVQLGITDNVKFMGAINYDDLSSYYYACDFFVLSSLSESFGKVILEAAVCGKPTLGSMATGPLSIIKDGETGFIAPANDVGIFKEKMLKLLNDDILVKTLGANAKQDVLTNYDFATNAKKITEMWNKIINS